MAVAWSGGLQAMAAPKDLALDAEGRKAVLLLQRLLEAAEDETRQPGADPSDVPAKAAELGFDVERCFAFVRDSVAFEPYVGVLRGARGALASGSGNALDRSLLLAGLLEAGGHRCRVVSADLPPDRARELVDRFLTEGGRLPAPAGDDQAAMQRLLQRTGLDAAALAEYQASAAAEAGQNSDAIQALTGPNADYLMSYLNSSGVRLGRGFDAWRKLLEERALHHAWVQLADGDTWIDLDTSLVSAKRGQKFADQPVAIDDTAPLRHSIDFELIYTRQDGEGTADETILSVPLYADELLDAPPAFAIQPADDMPSLEKMAEMSAAEKVKLITDIEKYQALMKVGARSYGSKAFDLKGNTFEVSNDGRIEGAQKIGAAVGGMFGGALGGDDEAADAGSRFVKLSVRFTFHSPGEPPRPQERVLSTKEDVEAAHFISPLLTWDMLVQPQPLSQKLAEFGLLRHTARMLGPVVAALAGRTEPEQAMRAVTSSSSEPFSPLLVDFALTRQGAIADTIHTSPGLALLWDRPQVVLSESRVCVGKGTDHACSMARLDIVDNGLAFVPRSASDAASAALATFRQGVFDTAAEAQVLQRAAEGADLKVPGTAIAATDVARTGGEKLVSFAPGDAAGPSAVSAADRAWISAYEQPGRIIVASANADGPSIWWSTDPATGSTIGRVAGGGGAAMTERAVKEITIIVKFILCWGWDVMAAMNTTSGTGLLIRMGICAGGMGLGMLALSLKTPGFLLALIGWEILQKSLPKMFP
jgi:hypothetical protein